MKCLTCVIFIISLLSSPVGARCEDEIYDPLEPVNRGVFWLNDKLDIYLFEPVAKGYNFVVPKPAQRSVTNFFDNLRYPAFLVSDVVELKFKQAGVHTGRFLVNTTLGLLGLFDVAKHFGLEPHIEDFGAALGYDGIPPGPYLVLPILGPSDFRDVFGLAVDSFLDPVYYIPSLPTTLSLRTTDFVNTRSSLLEAVQTGKDSSLDFYLFVQAAYFQRRESRINDGHSSSGSLEDDLDDAPQYQDK